MKRALVLFICIMGIPLIYACTGTVETEPGKIETVVEKKQKEETREPLLQLGWIDGDTYRTRADGVGKDKALSNAQLFVMEKFIAERMKASGMKFDAKSTGVAIVDEFGGTVKSGSIVREKADADGKISIIYEVKSNNLRSRVRTGSKQ